MQIEILLCGRMTKPPENVCDFFSASIFDFFSYFCPHKPFSADSAVEVGDAGEHFKRTLMFVC